jgi:hypothetical protein
MEVAMSHAPARPSADEVRIPDGHIWTKLPIVLFVTALLALVAGYLVADDHYGFSFAWLVGFLYAASISLGALFFVLMQHASKAGWSVVVRRVAENLMTPLPLLILMFIPLYLGRHDLYHHWMDTEAVAHDPILSGKEAWLNEGFWTIRAGIYLVVWSLLGLWFYKRSVNQDSAADAGAARKITLGLQNSSYPMIAVFALSITFAAFDWAMSLDPHWFSTMWGVYYFAGTIMAGFAVLGMTVLLMQRSGLLTRVINAEHLHDIGKLVFAFTVFWAYISFSQFMLIWYANIPEETTFFHLRMGEGNPWETIGIVLMAGHFGLPFLFMMPRTIKRNSKALLAGCIYMLMLHFVDLCWAILPANSHATGTITASAVLIALGLFSIMWGTALLMMRRSALLPVRDPRLDESLAFTNF